MITAAVIPVAALLLCAAMALAAFRLLRGPQACDRILALDALYINAIALLVLVGIHRGSAIDLELVTLLALLGFVGTLALAKFVEHRDIAR
jgi:multicomponent K+:H+ antiporter subunit F